jgi:hypothetical protein
VPEVHPFMWVKIASSVVPIPGSGLGILALIFFLFLVGLQKLPFWFLKKSTAKKKVAVLSEVEDSLVAVNIRSCIWTRISALLVVSQAFA